MAPAGSQPPQVSPWIVAISVMFGTFMVVLDKYTLADAAAPSQGARQDSPPPMAELTS
jgi:hypothetical protein